MWLDDCKLKCPEGIIKEIKKHPEKWNISISVNHNHFNIEHIDYMLSWRGCKEESVIIRNGNCFTTVNNIFPNII
jgi:hypothetical protein